MIKAATKNVEVTARPQPPQGRWLSADNREYLHFLVVRLLVVSATSC
jgi:hypothetical protein